MSGRPARWLPDAEDSFAPTEVDLHEATRCTFHFDRVVWAFGIPAWPDAAGNLPIEIGLAVDGSFDLIYAVDIVSPITVPPNDPTVVDFAYHTVTAGAYPVT